MCSISSIESGKTVFAGMNAESIMLLAGMVTGRVCSLHRECNSLLIDVLALRAFLGSCCHNQDHPPIMSICLGGFSMFGSSPNLVMLRNLSNLARKSPEILRKTHLGSRNIMVLTGRKFFELQKIVYSCTLFY